MKRVVPVNPAGPLHAYNMVVVMVVVMVVFMVVVMAVVMVVFMVFMVVFMVVMVVRRLGNILTMHARDKAL